MRIVISTKNLVNHTEKYQKLQICEVKAITLAWNNDRNNIDIL